jgi:signal transduction histidine kinase
MTCASRCTRMGLFAEALRQRSRDPEVAGLVNSINESVDALEGLFGELLDITRIDTGGVEVNPQAGALRDLFARLRLHFEPTGLREGPDAELARRAGMWCTADPVLLERVLRNLVSNAIRYTDDGGVLVSCRPRAGRHAAAGLGQRHRHPGRRAAAHLRRVLPGRQCAHRPQPHHRKGLGLGLAIVKRLAALMDAPLGGALAGGPWHVFTLELPAGPAGARPPGPRHGCTAAAGPDAAGPA